MAEAYKRLRVHGDFVNAVQRFFPPTSEPTSLTSAIHIYGQPQEIGFAHLSWLMDAAELPKSLALAEAGELPEGWDQESGTRRSSTRATGTRGRIQREWSGSIARCLLSGSALPVRRRSADRADKLLSPVSIEEQDAIRRLRSIQRVSVDFDPQISSGYHESGAKKEGLIKYDLSHPGDWSEVILKGIQIGLANPFFKSPTLIATTHLDWIWSRCRSMHPEDRISYEQLICRDVSRPLKISGSIIDASV